MRDLRRPLRVLKTRLIQAADQFLGWPPSAQIPAIVLLTAGLIAAFALIWTVVTGTPLLEAGWSVATRFVDGGTMAQDSGRDRRLLALAVTAAGILVVSFLTGAFASKLSERIQELKAGRSALLARDHVLILGFDAKVPLLVRELARSGQRLQVVVLADEPKPRIEGLLRPAERRQNARLRLACRTGDPRAEQPLLGVCAQDARAIVIIPPARFDDEHALRWSVNTLLSLRRVLESGFRGRLVVEARRAAHTELLALAAEGGVVGKRALPVDLFASDDIVARVLAQSIRQGGVYFALRELLSFRGSELYVEPVPPQLAGKSFDELHGAMAGGVVVGLLGPRGHRLSPPRGTAIAPGDRLIVLARGRGLIRPAEPLEPPRAETPPQPLSWTEATRFVVVGANRSLPRLITELDRIAAERSTVAVRAPALSDSEEHALAQATADARVLKVERERLSASTTSIVPDETMLQADAVLILGCEDEHDPDGDASALSILLHLRHLRQLKGARIRRLVTEVRDATVAQQVAVHADDFLVSTDVVAMLLAQACLEPRLVNAYRELLDPTGTEVFLVPRAVYAGPGPVRFGEIMSAARARGEVAIGVFPAGRPGGEARRLGGNEEESPVCLNPERDAFIPDGPDAAIVVLADPPEGASWR